ncbi:MAG: pyrimidine-nucleoside phosphorylase, partial [Chthoniobacteraceae bacterium]
MHVPTFIEKKRDGHELPAEEIAEFIRGYTCGEVPDYQAAAWAMAVYFKGMTATETGALTRAMMHSGR